MLRKIFIFIFTIGAVSLFSVGASAFSETEDEIKYDVCVDFGADGSDSLSDYSAIQAGLSAALNTDKKVTVYIPAGKYYIDNVLSVYSDTNLVLDKNSVIIRMDDSKSMLVSLTSELRNDDAEGGYGQIHDVSISGGTWDGNVTDTGNNKVNIYMGHGENISFSDMTVKNNCGTHLIELAGVKNTVLNNVVLDGFTPSTLDSVQTLSRKEALQLDITAYDCSSTMKPLDNTPCSYVTVENCTFRNYNIGVGSHNMVDGAFHDNITIKNNTFINITNRCIYFRNYKNFNVSENTAENASCFIKAETSDGNITDNDVVNNSNFLTANDGLDYISYSAVQLTDSTCEISKNSFNGNNKSTITLNASSADINGNNLNNSGSTSVYLLNSTADINNNDVSSSLSSGIYLNGSTANIKNNNIDKVTSCGVCITDGSVIPSLYNNKLTNIGGNGVYINGSSATSLYNNISGTTLNGFRIISGSLNSTGDKVKDTEISAVSSEGSTVTVSKAEISSALSTAVTSDTSQLSVSDSKLSGKGTLIAFHGAGTGNVEGNTMNIADGKIGIYTDGGATAVINGNTIYGGSNAVYNCWGSNIKASGNKINNCTSYGIITKKNSTAKIIGNTFLSCCSGIAFVDNSSGSTSGNVIKKSLNNGALISGGSVVSVSGDNISESLYNGIRIKDKAQANISGCTITGNYYNGLSIYNCSFINVHYCSIKGNGSSGISMSSGCMGTVSNNVLTNNYEYDVKIADSCTQCIVKNNTFGAKRLYVSANSSALCKNNVTDISVYSTVCTMTSKVYTGKAIKAKPSIIVGGNALKLGIDFTVTYSGNVKAGTAYVTIKGIGEYKGTLKTTFKITRRSISSATAKAIANKTYTGKVIKPGVVLTYNGLSLVNGTNYTLSYKNNKSTGKATVTVTGKGNFKGTKTVYFKIVPKKAVIKSLDSSSKRTFTVKWTKNSTASGYQIQYSTNKKFTSKCKSAAITKNSTVSRKVSGLVSGKTYYVRVRCYKTIGGVKAYGAWSAVKKIKIK